MHAEETHFIKLEGHLVECMYLWQGAPTRCFDGSLNKTIVKPRVAAAVGRKTVLKPRLAAAANTYTSDFPDVKFRVAAIIRQRRKQSSSGILTIIRIGLKS